MTLVTIADPQITETVRQWLLEPSSIVQDTFRNSEVEAYQRAIEYYGDNDAEILNHYVYYFVTAVKENLTAISVPMGSGYVVDLLNYCMASIDWTKLVECYLEQLSDFGSIEVGLGRYRLVHEG